MITKNNRNIFFIALMLFVFAFAGYAESGSKEPNILVNAHMDGVETDRLKPILYNEITAGYLNDNGLKAVIINNNSEISELLSTATWFGAFFLVEITITENGDEDELVFNAYSTWNSEVIKSSEIVVSVLFEYDVQLSKTLEGIVSVIRQYLQKTEVQTMIADFEAATEAPVVPGLNKPTEVSEQEASVLEAVEEEFKVETPVTIEKTSKTSIDENYKVTLAVSSGAFISIFRTADYFDVGFNIAFTGAYIFQSQGYDLTLGGLLDFTLFNAAGNTQQTKNLISSLGVTTTFEPLSSLTMNSTLSASLGISYFGAEAENGKFYTSIIPYGSGGLGIIVDLNAYASFIANLDLRIYFEKTITLTGFQPSIGLQFRR